MSGATSACVLIGMSLLTCRVWTQPVASDSTSLRDLPGEIPDAEQLFEHIETEEEDSELVDRLLWLQEHPFDLNKVSKEELETIPGITPADAEAVVEFRGRFRKLRSVSQLAALGDDGEEVLRKLGPYVFVRDVQTVDDGQTRTLISLKSRLVRDLQPRAGFQNGSFIGPSMKTYNRFSVSGLDHVEGGALFEKDAGERYLDGFVSGYIAAREIAFVSQVIVGDYIVEAGQGLVFWRSSSFGKGSDAIGATKRAGLGPQPYRSSDEFGFFRGITVTTGFHSMLGDVQLSGMISRRTLSASIDTNQTVTSFYTAGLFRTSSELNRRDAVPERLIGGRLRLKPSDAVVIGSSFYRSTFDKPVSGDNSLVAPARNAHVVGVDADVRLDRLTLFGEAARSHRGALAAFGGALLNVSKRLVVAASYRDYSPRFDNLHAGGFGDGSGTTNERGYYLGAEVRPFSWARLAGYLDLFEHPWRTFSNPLPTSGRDLLVQADVRVSPKLELVGRYSRKLTEGTEAALDSFDRGLRPILGRAQDKFRLTGAYQLTRELRIKGRLEFTEVEYSLLPKREIGYLLYYDIKYSIRHGFSIEARLAYFHTDSYDSRVYEYESDLRGVFSNPALYGKGRRYYVLIRYSPAGSLSISAKYSETQKDGVTSLGSGSTEIFSDTDNRISAQLEIRF